ncbi:MAG TPA: hypothetical protein DCE80_19315 [Ignavibacteriales bacterium]|nr:hypothetical protein [Ignavibacteriales bacterium]
MIKKILPFFLIIFVSTNAQNLFDFDYAQFGYDSTSNYLEFYYSFNQKSMKVSPLDSINVVKGILQISIEDTSSGQKIVDKEWRVSHQVTDSGEAGSKYLIGVVGFILPHGAYQCTIGGRDANDEKNQRV